MAATKTHIHDSPFPPRLVLALRALLLAAFCLSSYLAGAALMGSHVAGCGPESGCDKVLGSRWSSWLGIPVSLPALALYAVVFLTTFRLGKTTPVVRQRRAWAMLVFSAVAILGAVAWFVGLQLLVLHAVCPYCMTAHGLGAIAAVLILVKAPFLNPHDKPWKVEKLVFLRPTRAWQLSGLALAGVAVLVAGQLVYQPKKFAIRSLQPPAGQTNVAPGAAAPLKPPPPHSNSAERTATTQAAAASNALSAAPAAPAVARTKTGQVSVASTTAPAVPARLFPLYGGAMQLNLAEVPVLGNPEAPIVMVSLFDYSCHHCRIMHGHLMQLYRALSNQLLIVSLPMPLDPKCNHTIRRAHPDHVNACAYAKTGLAVWRVNPAKMHEFDNWMFAPEKPPHPSLVREYAAHLVGTNKLLQAMGDPWVERQLQMDINIYDTNYTHFHQGSMPQLLIGSNLISGTLRGPQDLMPVLARQPGFKLPPGMRLKGK